MPGHTADGATMRSVAWRLLSATTAGFEGSSTSSERSGGFRGWFVIHYCCDWSVIITYAAWRVTFCASHTDGYPYLATSYQRSVDLPGTVLRVPIPKEWVLSVQGRSVDLPGLMWVIWWLALSSRNGEASDGEPTRRCFYKRRPGLARMHCACLPRSSLQHTITSRYCTVARYWSVHFIRRCHPYGFLAT